MGIWDYFTRTHSTGICNVCQKELSLGSNIRKRQTTTTLKNHLKRHSSEYAEYTSNSGVEKSLQGMMCADEDLVAQVESFKLIYAKGSVNYRNKIQREQAWEQIAKNLQVDQNYCQSRWRSIRDRYVREMQKRRRTEANGSLATEWELLPMLDFLDDYVKPRKISLSVPTSVLSSEESNGPLSPVPKVESHFDFESSESRLNTPEPIPPLKIQNSYPVAPGLGEFQDFLKSMTDFAHNWLAPRNKNEPFLQMVQNLIEKLPEKRQDLAKLHILKYLTEEVTK